MPVQHIADSVKELATPGGKLLLAVSGGADSMALLRLVHEAGLPAEVATINHGLRPEAAEEVEFVREAAGRLGLAFHTAAFDTRSTAAARGWNIEETARRLRYQHLASIARSNGATEIVTAHTRDDQTETVLLQLIRGTAWLSGMRARSGTVIRPLLDVRRPVLTGWLTEIGQDWREDASNLDTNQARAWLRHEVLPQLRDRHPDLDERVANLAELQAEQKDFVNGLARPYVELDGAVDAGRLAGRHRALQLAVIAHMLRAHGAPVSLERLERAVEAVEKGETWRESVGTDKWLRLTDGRLEVIETDSRVGMEPVAVTRTSQLPEGILETALELPDLQFRNRLPGDRIRLAGGTRKVSDVLIDAKVPRENRDALQLLASGEQVLWIENVAVSVDFAARPVGQGETDWMLKALELAREAAAAGELPVGAVIVRDGQVVASARNETEQTGDPTAHAELLAVRRAAATTGDWRLSGCTLYVTLEPCAMCFGAMQQSHLESVVFAASNRREGATGSVADLDLLPWKRKVTVRRGPLEREAGQLLTDFFRVRRNGTS